MDNKHGNTFVTFIIPPDFIVANDESVSFDLRSLQRGELPNIHIEIMYRPSYALPTIAEIESLDARWVPDKEITFIHTERTRDTLTRGYRSQFHIHSEKLASVWGGDLHYGVFESYNNSTHWLIRITTKINDASELAIEKIAQDILESITFNSRSLEFYNWFNDDRRTSDTFV